MTVDEAAHLVGDRLVEVVAGDEHGVEGGDRARRRGARALDQPRQQREHARRIAVARERLARGQPDLALRARDPRQRVDEQEHVRAAAVAEPLGDRGRDVHGAQAHQWGASLVAHTTTVRARAGASSSPSSSPARGRARRRGTSRSHRPARRARSGRAASTCRRPPPRTARRAGRARASAACRARARPSAAARDRRPRRAQAAPARSTAHALAGQRRAAVDRLADAVEHAAEQVVAARIARPLAGAPHRRPPARRPASSPSGSSTACSPRKPTTSAASGPAPRRSMRTISPSATPGTVARTTSPTTSSTRPAASPADPRRCRSAPRPRRPELRFDGPNLSVGDRGGQRRRVVRFSISGERGLLAGVARATHELVRQDLRVVAQLDRLALRAREELLGLDADRTRRALGCAACSRDDPLGVRRRLRVAARRLRGAPRRRAAARASARRARHPR